MDALLQFFNGVPAIVWSGLFGASLALGGVLISNSGNNRRLRVQLQHDAIEKNKDRVTNMRREVYLKAVEDMTVASQHLGNLPQRDVLESNLALDMQGFFTSCAKIQVIAEPDTALKVGRIGSHYGELMLKLMVKAGPLHGAKSDIKIRTKIYEESLSESKRILAALSKHQESANPDNSVYSALIKAYELQCEMTDKYAEEMKRTWDEFSSLLTVFNKDLMEDMAELSSYHLPVLVAIRQDLGLSSNVAEHTEQLKKHQESFSKAVTKAMDDLSK